MVKRLRVSVAAVLSLIAMAAPAAAQSINRSVTELLGAMEVPIEQQSKGNVTLRVGLGAIVTSRLDAPSNLKVYPLPLIGFEYHNWLSIDETQVRVNLINSDSPFRAGPMVRFDPGRGNFGNPGIPGLGKTPVSLEAGGFVSYSYGPARIRLRLRHNVTSSNGGSVGELDLRSGVYKSGPVGVAVQVQTVWASKNYMERIYGVTATQSVKAHLPAFYLGPGMKDVNVTIYSEYKFSTRWSAVGAVQYVHVLGDAADSPIVRVRGSGNRVNVGMFVVYAFGTPNA